MLDSDGQLLGICIGNTRTRYARFLGAEIQDSASLENSDPEALAGALVAVHAGTAGAPIVIASVNAPVAEGLERALAARTTGGIYKVGRDLAVPIGQSLAPGATVGQDRLLCALGAYSRAKQACIVIDAGTAITVDFVDGSGDFQGGAIAPGVAMMLRSLHEGTAALPQVRFEPPAGPFGKDTAGAMRLGVRSAIIGLVHELVDRYAEFFGAYPQVVATGGDAHALFAEDPIVEHIVPDLQLMGLQVACAAAIASEGASEDEE